MRCWRPRSSRALVALAGYLLTQWQARRDRKLKVFADTLAAVAEYEELPYRIRRRRGVPRARRRGTSGGRRAHEGGLERAHSGRGRRDEPGDRVRVPRHARSPRTLHRRDARPSPAASAWRTAVPDSSRDVTCGDRRADFGCRSPVRIPLTRHASPGDIT